MRPILSIIIVNYNTKKLLKQCLESILANDPGLDFVCRPSSENGKLQIPSELIIVDNNSTDGSREYLKRFLQQNPGLHAQVILNKKNLGFAKANNQGIKIAKGEYILLLNSDTIIPAAAISQTLLWMTAHPEAAVVGCKLLNPDKTPQASVGRFPSLPVVAWMLFLEHWLPTCFVRCSPGKVKAVDWVVGAFLLARRFLFEEVGLLDEKFFMYLEEVDWCFRVKKAGYQIFFYPGARVIHLGGGSSPSGRTFPILSIYRGLLYFYQKHYPYWQGLILRLLLKIKAGLAFVLGVVSGNDYLKKTYRQAWGLV